MALAVVLATDRAACAQSVVPWLGGFDVARVESVSQWVESPNDAQTLAEAAKLLYRMRRIDRDALLQQVSAEGKRQPGDATAMQGTAGGLTASPLPPELAEVLEMDRVYRLSLAVDDRECTVITSEVPHFWLTDPQSDWPAVVTGIVLRSDAQGRPTVVATSRVQWHPVDRARVPLVGWALLGRQGFDVGRLGQVIAADRQPLTATEQEAFYGMLAAAERVAGNANPPPQPVTVAQLLSGSQALVGQWVRIDLETARLTRIAVTDPRAAQRLGAGRDHYWQIDGFADLGDVQVKLESLESDGEPVLFDNRYPVSLATVELPATLRQAVEAEAGRGAVVAMVRRSVTADGFFYRLWSYPSEYARSRGGGQPYGPLIMAARVEVLPAAAANSLGVEVIGWIAAAGCLVVLAVIVIGSWHVGRRDRQIALARRQREAATFESAAGGDRDRTR